MKTRKLTLRRELLSELTTGELASVAGASGVPCHIEIRETLIPTCGCTGHYPTVLEPCN